MSLLCSWLLGVTAAALAVALAQALTPEGSVRRVVRLAGGLVLLLAALRPVPTLEWDGLAALRPPDEIPVKYGSEDVWKTLIAQKAGAYILDKGRALGCELTGVKVTVVTDDSGWPVPWAAEITGTWTPEQKRALARWMEGELDIPTARQSFEEEGT